MKRRHFIAQTSAAAAALTLPSLGFGREADATILGHGSKKFTLDENWGKLDAARYPVKDCHEMVQDSKHRLLMLGNDTHNNVLIYNHKGKLLASWGNEYPGGHGLTLSNENGTEVLFITDTERHQVYKTTLTGKLLMTIEYPKATGLYAKPEEFTPTETAIAPNGDIYIADGYGKDYIVVFDEKGKFKHYFGGRGTEPWHLKNAHGIALDVRNPSMPQMVVTSREENAFKRFTLDGRYIATIPMPGAWVCRPVIKGQFMYAAVLQSSNRPWKESGFITILDNKDQVISNPGGTAPALENGKMAEMQQVTQRFKYPHDVCVDDEGNIYMTQWNSGHVYPFKLKPVH